MAMYAMTVMGEWSVNAGQRMFARVMCDFAAEATLAGVLAVHIRYVDAEDRAPRGFRCLPD
jgi:hypothetical protein